MKKYVLIGLITLLFSCENEEVKDSSPVISVENITIDNKGESLKEIEAYIFKNPSAAKGYLDRATYYLENKEMTKAFESIETALGIEKKDAQIFYIKGQIYNKMGKIEMALPFFQTAMKLDSTHIQANLKAAYIYLSAKNFEESLAFINRIIVQDKFLAEPYYLKGMWYEHQGENDLAISSYQTAVERNSNYYEAYLALGSAHDRMDNSLAISYFDAALSVWPQSIEAWRAKAMSYFNHQDLEKAYVCFDTILSIDSTFEVSYFDMGRTLIGMCYDDNSKQKNDSLLGKAIENFDKALQLNSNYVPAHYNRGYCYEILGNKEIAKEEYKYVLSIEPNYDLAVKGLNRL